MPNTDEIRCQMREINEERSRLANRICRSLIAGSEPDEQLVAEWRVLTAEYDQRAETIIDQYDPMIRA